MGGRWAWSHGLVTGLLIATMILPWAGLLRGRDSAAAIETEKRELAPRPAWPKTLADLRTFPRRIDAYFADHFGFRDALIKAHSRLLVFGLRTSPSDRVIVGRSGWLYYNGRAANDGDPIADFRGIPPLSFAELERWRWAFQDQHDWLVAHGLKHLVVLVPAKEIVYPENFPSAHTRLGPPTIEQIRRHLTDRTDIPLLDLTPALVEARDIAPVYFEADTHWNPYGAYVGYREIINGLAAWYPAMVPMPETAFVRDEQVGQGGDLAVMIQLQDQINQTWVFMNPQVPLKARITPLGEDELAEIVAVVDDPTLPKVAILRDSFTVFLVPYLSEHFSSTHYMWARTGFDMALVGRTQPDLILQIVADRTFRKFRRYPAEMETFAVRQRFDATPPGLGDGIELTAGPGTNLERVEDGWIIENPTGSPSVLIDLPAEIATRLPLIRWTLEVFDRADVTMTWESAEPDVGGSNRRRATPAALPPGVHEVTWAIVDPDSMGPITLHLGRRPGRVLVRDVEMRFVDR